MVERDESSEEKSMSLCLLPVGPHPQDAAPLSALIALLGCELDVKTCAAD
jgi:hypothetical protein